MKINYTDTLFDNFVSFILTLNRLEFTEEQWKFLLAIGSFWFSFPLYERTYMKNKLVS